MSTVGSGAGEIRISVFALIDARSSQVPLDTIWTWRICNLLENNKHRELALSVRLIQAYPEI